MTIQADLAPLIRPQHPLQTVLIGTSLETGSDEVVRAGLALARAAKARVYLVHAAPVEPRLIGFEPELDLELAQEQIASCREKLRQQIERLGIGESELAGSTVLTGAPQRVILEAAGTARASLLVVGATGSGPFVTGLLGSTADRVVRKSACPVLVVRGELRVPPRRVLAPVDLSTLSGDAFRCGLHLLAQMSPDEKVEVQAVYALRFPDSFELQRRRQRESSAAEVARQSEEELRRFILENRSDSPFEVETAVLPEQAPFAILDELNEHPADLVMLGTHGSSGLDRLMMGSVASTIVRKAPCSVLLISPEAALAEAAQSQPAWHRERASAA